MSNLFDNEVSIDPEKDYSPEIIGDGKKYKDLKAVARAVLEKDAHIKRVEDEAKALREDLQKRVTLEEVMTRLAKTKEEEPKTDTTPDEANQPPVLTKEQLEALIAAQVAQTIEKTKTETVAERNVNTVTTALKQAWGDNYVQVLTEKTKELGLGKDWVTDLARTQPRALLTLVGLNTAKPIENPLAPGSLNTSAFSTVAPTEKTMKYYKELKLKDPVKYHSKEVRAEMMAQGKKLGEAFFDV